LKSPWHTNGTGEAESSEGQGNGRNRSRPYLEALKKLDANPPKAGEAKRQLSEFRWMVEEFKVSLFAQELGTQCRFHPKGWMKN